MNTKKINLITMPRCGTDHPHIGIGYLTANLEKYGFETVQYDINLDLKERLPEEFKELYLLHSRKWSQYEDYEIFILPIIEDYLNQYAYMLSEDDAGIIGFSMYYSNIFSTFKLAQKIKILNPEKIIIIGGPEASSKYSVFDCVDYIVIGEGEETLLELMMAIDKHQSVNKVRGISYKIGGRIVNTESRPLIKDLDKLAFPVFQNFNEKKYNNECIPLLGSRGCVNRCSFCTESKYWKSYRSRSAENIYQEIELQLKRYGAYQSNGELRELVFLDSLVNADIGELMKLCSLLIENNVTPSWVAKATISRNLTEDSLQSVKKSGCKKLMFGLESGSSSVLEKMRKRFDIPTAERVIHDAHKSGLEVMLYILIGFPTETDFHFQETLEFIQRNKEFINEIVPGVGCQVEKESDLFINREIYGIHWKRAKDKNSENWYTEHSAFATRIDRVNRFISHCNVNNIKVITSSLEASVPQLIEDSTLKISSLLVKGKEREKIESSIANNN